MVWLTTGGGEGLPGHASAADRPADREIDKRRGPKASYDEMMARLHITGEKYAEYLWLA